MKNKKTLVMGIIIAALVVVIAVMGFFLMKGSKNQDSPAGDVQQETTDMQTSETTATSEDGNTSEQAAATEEKTEGDKADAENHEDFYVEIGHENTWEQSGKKCATENIKIYNKSKNSATGWKLDIEYKGKPVIMDDNVWNGVGKIKGNTITITPADYNKDIASDNMIDLGYNISSDDLTVQKYILYIGDKQYEGVPSGGSAVVKTEPETKTDTEAVTESEAKTEEVTESDGQGNSEKKDDKASQSKDSGTPVENHGKLAVKGTDIVDKNGDKYQLKGVSTHGITWFPDYVNKDAFQSLRDSWGANLVRIAMYTDTGDSYGFCSGGDKDKIKALVDTGVSAATELGMYAIVDWHILNDNNPNNHIDDAKAFFEEMSAKYSTYDNVLYEICNEPNGGTSWSDVKSYAETIIPIIRKNDKDAIIIVGTPNWSQDVDVASEDPVTGYDNIMYAVHFYAATHKDDLRNKVNTALSKGLPVFVSEFSLCDASGNGGIDYDSSDEWFKLINDKNLSFASWSLCNKNETSALIRSDSTKVSDFTVEDLSDTGKYIRDRILGN